MKAVVKEEHNAPKVVDEGGDGGHGNRCGYCRGARRLNNVAGGGSSGNTPNAKYPTCNKDLVATSVFHVAVPRRMTGMFLGPPL